jgi:hypothetical protein
VVSMHRWMTLATLLRWAAETSYTSSSCSCKTRKAPLGCLDAEAYRCRWQIFSKILLSATTTVRSIILLISLFIFILCLDWASLWVMCEHACVYEFGGECVWMC